MNPDKTFKLVKNSYGLLQKRLFKDGRALRPLSVIILLTLRCPFRCQMCFLEYQKNRLKTTPSYLQEELSLKEICELINLSPSYSIITFTGGEPFLRSDFPNILSYAARRRKCHLITNGFYLNEEMAELLIQCASSSIFSRGLFLVGISLMGDRTTHDAIANVSGSFDKIVHNYLYLKDLKQKKGKKFPLLEIKLTIFEKNHQVLPEMVEIISQLSPDYFAVQAESRIKYPWYSSLQGGIPLAGLSDSELYKYPEEIILSQPEKFLNDLKDAERQLEKSPTRIRLLPSLPFNDFLDHFGGEPDLKNCFCVSPWTDLFIGPYGDVGICLGGTCGNIRELDPYQLFNSQKFRNFRIKLREKSIFKACRGCCFFQKS